MHHHLILLTLTLTLTLTITAQQQPNLAVPPDAVSLLTFKLSADKTNTLHYTLHEPLDFCQWQGVKCQAGRIVRFTLLNSFLNGTFPSSTLSNLTELRVLVLRNTSLSGPLPSDLSSLSNLRSLILPYNSFSGPFPISIFRLHKLRVIDFSFNLFYGHIPPAISILDRLLSLKLQFNHFTGALPLINQTLDTFNVSGNNFSGHVPATLSHFPPSSFLLNPNLCGKVVNKPCVSPSPFFDSAADHPSTDTSPVSFLSPPPRRTHHFKKMLFLGFSFAGVFLLASLFCIVLTSRKSTRHHRRREKGAVTVSTDEYNDNSSGNVGRFPATSPEVIRVRLDSQSNELKEKCKEIVEGGGGRREKSGDLVYCGGERSMYTLEQLMRASAEMLGRGNMGTTYKAKLDNNQLILTVKRLDAMKMIGVNGEMFEERMRVVGMLRHPNLVPVRAYFQAREERLIIYDYQPNGSVFTLIHGSRSTRAKPLHWTSCLKIAEDVAQGLAYIHQASKLIHGNLKASNVLLGIDFEACITDYCIATLAAPSDNEDPDSARYRGPEARQSGRRANHKTDVYAFGVLLLELLSGKPPSQHPFLAPPDMPDWVKAMRGVDDSLEDSQLSMLVEVSSLCSLTSPEQRPPMWQVLKMIQKIKASVSQDDTVDPS